MEAFCSVYRYCSFLDLEHMHWRRLRLEGVKSCIAGVA